jgi:hypothetical protein
MRWGFGDGVCQNCGPLGSDAVYSGKRVEEFRRNSYLNTEYAGSISLRIAGKIYKTTRHHIPDYRSFSAVKYCWCCCSFSHLQITILGVLRLVHKFLRFSSLFTKRRHGMANRRHSYLSQHKHANTRRLCMLQRFVSLCKNRLRRRRDWTLQPLTLDSSTDVVRLTVAQ